MKKLTACSKIGGNSCLEGKFLTQFFCIALFVCRFVQIRQKDSPFDFIVTLFELKHLIEFREIL
jgi:hypothetical protein